MTDETQNSEIVEVAPPAVEVSQDDSAIKARQEADERNWKAMRIKNGELEKRLKQFEDMQMQIMQAQISNSAPKPIPDEFDSIGDAEYISKGQVQKLVEKKAQQYAEQIAKQEIERHVKQQNDSQFMDRLNRQYSDFSEVVNPETLSLLEEREPELAKVMADSKDPYKIGMQSYKYIKALGLNTQAPEVRREKELDKKIAASDKAVPSPAAFDKRPIATAFKMTDAMKKDLYREMMGYAAMAGGVPEIS